jgi:prolyl-tRNA synthetase
MGFGRVLAAVISQHGDDHGIILPPIVAPKQAVIIPIPIKGKEAEAKRYASKVAKTLEKAGVRAVLDDDDRLRPGEKFYKWEMYGVPLRIEIGPREAKSNTVTIVRRDTFEKVKADLKQLVPTVRSLLDAIFENLRDRSRKYMEGTIADARSVDELLNHMEERKIARINWCGDRQCADNLKERVSGEIRGTLWGTEEQPDGPCILCGDPAKSVAYFSKAY